MERIADLLATGRNVAVEAVPGAGKTHLLRKLCEDGVPTLVLAYNAQLAAEVQAALCSVTAVCATFHALCARCLAPACDDTQLEDAVQRAECGELVPHDVPDVRRVFVDEAQDVRRLFVRLLRVLGLANGNTSILAAGDRNQLIYDFDEDFPATLDTLLRPQLAFGGEWEHVDMSASRRLTAPIARFVNAVFGTHIEAKKDGPAVEVRAPASAFGLADTLRDLLVDADHSTLLLVDRKRGNRPLRTLLNALSREGRRVCVHGMDDDDEEEALRCGTYWSAKGLECDTAVVLLPARAPRNPTYVALTRARRRLVVVLDHRAPHAAVCRAVSESLGDYTVASKAALRAVAQGSLLDAEDSFAAAGGGERVGGRGNLDWWAPGRAACAEWTAIDTPPEAAVAATATSAAVPAGVGAAAVATALVVAEATACGRVRAMEDVLHPTRLDHDQVDEAAHAGFVGRWVPRFVTDDTLLADDLRATASRAYRRLLAGDAVDLAAAAEVALATLAWDGFDHTMRRMRPVGTWRDTARTAVDHATRLLPRGDCEYDTRLRTKEHHVRVHATTPRECYHVVWGTTSGDEAAAAVRAACHPRKRCVLVDLSAGIARTVTADRGLLPR